MAKKESNEWNKVAIWGAVLLIFVLFSLIAKCSLNSARIENKQQEVQPIELKQQDMPKIETPQSNDISSVIMNVVNEIGKLIFIVLCISGILFPFIIQVYKWR